jgi:hypothetical protein
MPKSTQAIELVKAIARKRSHVCKAVNAAAA